MRNLKIVIGAVIIFALVLPGFQHAQALKNSENDPLSYLRTLPKPNMLMIADTSGSMRGSIYGNQNVRGGNLSFYQGAYAYDADHLNSRMKNLKDAISAIVTSVQGINFGLARFNNWTKWFYYWGSAEVSPGRYVWRYCFNADPADGIGTDYGDCVYLQHGWKNYEDSNNDWNDAKDDSDSGYDNQNEHVHLLINGEHKRYQRIGRVWIPATDPNPTIWKRIVREYDPFDNDPPFPPDTLMQWIDGHYVEFTRTYVQVYRGQWSYGLYQPYIDGIPHVSVDIRNDYDDDPLTPEDEADNTAALLKSTGNWDDEGAFIPMGGTPLDASLYDAYKYFKYNIIPRDDPYPDIKQCRKNYVILITDGQSSDGEFYDKAINLYNDLGVKTFGIALNLSNSGQIDRCADAGDDGVRNGSTTAYACDNTEEVVDAIKEIVADISDQLETLAPPVVSTVYSHPYWDDDPDYAGELDESEASMVLPFFQYPSWRGHLLATWLYKISYNSRIPDDPGTAEDERWISYEFNQYDLWNAGYVLSYENAPLRDTNNDTYINELDTFEANSGYKAADDRVIYTTTEGANPTLIPFDSTLPNKVSRLAIQDADVNPILLTAWQADVARRQYLTYEELADVVINAIRGKLPIKDVSDSDGDGNVNDWVRDPATQELLYSEKTWKMGNTVGSIPAIISVPSGLYLKRFFNEDYVNGGELTYTEFSDAFQTRPRVVIFGTNAGVLHCFAMEDIDKNTKWGENDQYSPPRDYIAGEEVWAFVPGDPDVMKKLKMMIIDHNGDGEVDGQIYKQRQSLRDPADYEWLHWYYLDGPVRYTNIFIDTDGDGEREWHTIALIGEGRGGRYYYCFDITDPFNPTLMWKYPTDADNSNQGVAVSTPAIAHQSYNGSYRWLAFLGGGYDAEDDPNTEVAQHFYGISLEDASVVYDFNEPVAADTGSKKAMLMAGPSVFNSNVGLDYVDDKVFVGDTDGHLWRFDLNQEVLSMRLDFEDEDQAIVASVSAAHPYGDAVWWDVVFVGSGGDTRSDPATRRRLVGFVDESYSMPYAPAYPTIAPSESGPDELPPPISVNDDIDAFQATELTFFHVYLNEYEMNDAQPTTNVVETNEYSKLQTFFTLFNPGSDPCVVGSSRLLEFDHIISKSDGELSRVHIPSGAVAGEVSLGEGKSGGTYVSDGVVFAPAKNKVNIFGKPVPPPPPKGNKAVVNILSWKVISD